MMKFPTKKQISILAKKYDLRVLILFGSHAIGKTHKESDLDLAFYSLHKIDEEKFYQDTASLFHRADIDLINIFTTHNHILRYRILSTGTILYEKEKGLKNQMEWQSYFDYRDFQKYYKVRETLLNQKIDRLVKGG